MLEQGLERLNPSVNAIQQSHRDTQHLNSLSLTSRQLCDLELILNGGFAPLTTFLDRKDYENVLTCARLANGILWPMPIMLDIDAHFIEKNAVGDSIALRDQEGMLLAVLTIEECWEIEKEKEAQSIYGTQDPLHPGVHYLFNNTKDYYISGPLKRVSLPHHYDFNHLRKTPQQLKHMFTSFGVKEVIAFQTRNPMHKAHQALTLAALAQYEEAHLLIHPAVGLTKPGDIDYFIRVKCYEEVLKSYPDNKAHLSLLPLAMRMAGPKEALWHALIRKNYGCTHFIVGRDHAGPGKNSLGKHFYDPYAAQELTLKHQAEMGITIIPFQEMAYSKKHEHYYFLNNFPKDDQPSVISGSELRNALQTHAFIPEWFSFPNIIKILRQNAKPKHEHGFTIFLTGLPSSGKSTVANALLIKLRELTLRPISLLDGDIIRKHLSFGLGFSKEDRHMNVTRVGYVAREVSKHGGIAICALVSPFASARDAVRKMISEVGGFLEVYISTPLTICEERDRKGLYKKAREGLINNFTGVNDQYEAPATPEITLDTSQVNVHDAIDHIVNYLKSEGYLLEQVYE